MKLQVIFFLFFFLFASACKKLPKETHKGKGTMACYINGEKWEAKDKRFTFDLSTIGTGVQELGEFTDTLIIIPLK